ncbi:MAG: hypothetical protein V3T65_06510 [Acidobacteriota bacterium]
MPKQKDAAAQQKALCDSPQSREKNDLCQQWRMAEAAEEMADWTLGQILATGVEAVLLAIAIGVAWWAGSWAKRAAIAGNETVETTREIGLAQARAYVHPMGLNIVMDENGMITGTARVENVGKTPAYKLVCRITITVTPLPFSEEVLKYDAIPEQFSTSTLPPGGSVKNKVTTPGLLTAEYQSDIAAGRAAIFIHGRLEYQDVFQSLHSTNFRHMYTGPWGGQKPLRACEEGNEAT